MKPFMLRLVWLFAAIIFAAALIGAAGMLGRGSTSLVAVVQDSMRVPNRVGYTLIDVDRRIKMSRALRVPAVLDERWYAQPPLVFQRTTRGARGEFVDWIVSSVDVRRSTLSPVMTLTTGSNARFSTFDLITRDLPDGKL